MEIIGVIAEYNPFHNGHKYHIDSIKKMYPDSIVIAVISSSFTQRGEVSILNKWDKTRIALLNGIDIVIELPFYYSTQSADYFAYGSLKILNAMNVNKIIVGSEVNDIDKLKVIAYNEINKTIIKDNTLSFPKRYNSDINTPNDTLILSYIKEIINNNYSIEIETIKRTTCYLGNDVINNITSASNIRKLLNDKKCIKDYIPYDDSILYRNIDIYKYLKYNIYSNIDHLFIYRTVDEGIEGRIKKFIDVCDNYNELVNNIKTKRYTYNRINRMFIHILTSFEKKNLEMEYIRILGFNSKGRKYINDVKNKINLKIITGYKNNNFEMLELEKKVTRIYSILVNDKSLIKREIEKPIIFD